MNKRRALIMLALALLFGLAAVLLAARWLLRPAPAAANHIIVAASDISLGQRLTPELLKTLDWPAESMPHGAVHDSAALVGRVLRTSVLRDEPLSLAKLAPAGTTGGLSALISTGKRAITVRVNDVVGVAGFALPGNFVDILVNMQASASGSEHAISRIVLERILVLAVAQEVGRDETRPKVVNAVTLEVTPAQAESIDLARSVGSLSLVLRNQVDPLPGVTTGATRNTLLHIEAPPVPADPLPQARAAAVPAQPRRHCIGVIAGTQQVQECL
ncbi:Flp pilus assembly protein CpaB [Pseudoduganella danionis]|uniref:Flp pilus assembly protein CpaB n=1 Tax=Pseudoduganella danionis TaxID=1890295 RepID=UPI0035B0CB57